MKEKSQSRESEKLGERDDTIPPEYRHLLDNDGKDKPEKPLTKKTEKPDQDRDPIDALSEDLDSCPSTTETSKNTAKVLHFFQTDFFEIPIFLEKNE